MTIQDEIWLLAHSKEPEDRREWAVLYFKSQGLTHRQVGEKLGYGKDWVQRYMTSAYRRFGAPKDVDKDEKFEWLEKNVFPALREFIAGNPDTLKELPPPPLGDALIEPPPPPPPSEPPIIIIDSPKRLPGTTEPNYIRLIILLIAIVGIVSAVGYAAYKLGQRSTPTLAPAITAVTAVTQVISVIPSAPAISPKPPVLPTNVPTDTQIPTLQITETPIPSPTIPFAPPANGILFQDNFDNGIGSDWITYGGQWLIVNGRLTLLQSKPNSSLFDEIGLNKPEWKNYDLSLDISIPSSNSTDIVVVAVRNNTTQSKLVGFEIDFAQRIFLALVAGDWSNTVPISGTSTGFSFPTDSPTNVEMHVQGDTYVLSTNHKELQRITLSGYTSGGIVIGSHCGNYKGCPSLGNVKVTYLP